LQLLWLKKQLLRSINTCIMSENSTNFEFKSDSQSESARQLSTLISNLPGVVYRCKIDKNWTMLFLSHGIEDLTGYHSEEIFQNINVSYTNIIHPDDREHVYKTILEQISKKELFTIEYRITTKNGSEKWIWERGQAVPDLNSKTWVLEGFLLDITDKKLSEKLVQYNKKYLELIVSQCPAVIYVLQKDCNSTQNNAYFFEFVSENSSDIFGLKPDYFLQNNDFWLRHIHPDDMDLVLSNINNICNNGEQQPIAYRMRNVDNTYVWVSNSQKVIERNSAYTKIIGSWFDISKLKHAENEIKAKNKELSESNLQKDKLFSLIAHDLKSPFGAFLGLIELIVEKADIMKPDKIQEIAVAMYDTATNLYRLIENLLDWTKIQRQGFRYKPENYLLLPLYSECIKLYVEAAQKKNISLVTQIESQTNVFADADMLKTILRNLVSNAIKFTTRGGFVTVTAKQSKNEGFIDIIVQDTGIGIEPDAIKNMFTIDKSLRRNGTEGEPSTGLGLIICKEYTMKHGGAINVESTHGKGSKFIVSIPEKHTTSLNS